MLSENPDIVVNDMLNTEMDDVVPLREKGIKVVNFEDLGKGASYSDITINELFETPLIKSKNILKNLKEIKIIEFDHNDVVRHPLVSKIIRAYQKKSTDDKN